MGTLDGYSAGGGGFVRSRRETLGRPFRKAPEIVWPGIAADGSRPWPATDAEAQAAGLTKLVRASDGHVVYARTMNAREIAAHPESGYVVESWSA